MLLILISTIIAIVLIKSSIDFVKEIKEYNYLPFFPPLFLLGMFIGIFGISYGIFGATDYGEWEVVERIELVSLSNSTVSEGDDLLYVNVYGKNVYTYRYETNTEDNTGNVKDYITDTISGNIIEREDKNCKIPELIVERKSPKRTIWTLGLGWDNTHVRYIFHVPYGTISHEVKLK